VFKAQPLQLGRSEVVFIGHGVMKVFDQGRMYERDFVLRVRRIISLEQDFHYSSDYELGKSK
jgi:hypothetical protein